MTAATFDTRAAAEALRAAEFTERQAAAAVDMVRDAMAEGVATKADLRAETSSVRAETSSVRAETSSVRAEIANVRAEIAELKAYLTVRLYAAAAAVIAAMFGMLKLL